MRLFKGQIEVKETDTVKVHQSYLTVFDKNCNRTYYEDSNYWSKREFDKNGNEKYFENSHGRIIDNRLKEISTEELTKMGYKLKDNRK